MRHCVQYALDRADRSEGIIEPLDLAKISKLTFARVDREAFPLLDLALHSLEAGGASCAVLNASNEVAVSAYLSEKISFGEISDAVIYTVEKMSDAKNVYSLDGILCADREAREVAKSYLKI